jgi:glycosyltransferase involved in cell wall biosynthesis
MTPSRTDTQTLQPATTSSPAISIGLPVYNGARYLPRAIESLLSQTFRDVELIISDNASTDDTKQICSAFQRQDPRIRYFRQPVNIGAPRNWNFVVMQARAPFFKWASANDYCAPTLLSQCFDVLTQHPAVVLCYSRTTLIDEFDNTIQAYDRDFAVLDDRPSDRYKHIRRSLALNNAQMGLIRVDALTRTHLEGTYPGSDLVLMAELALLGRFWLLDDALFCRRLTKDSASRFLSETELNHFIDPQARPSGNSHSWRLHRDFVGVVMRSPLSLPEKLRCLRLAARRAYWDRRDLWSEIRVRLSSKAPDA